MELINVAAERRKALNVVESNNFDYVIMFVIFMDAFAIGMLTFGLRNADFLNQMFLLDRLCMAIYLVEMLIKMYAYGPRFFKSGWNMFDLGVILISFVAGYFIILRTFRLFRLLRYVTHFKRLKSIINIMLAILPNFFAMMVVLSVFIYVFAVMGVVLFGDRISAFENLGASIFSLIQCFTLDGWASTIARPVMRIYPHAWLFFTVYVMISFLLAISFVLSVIALMVKREFKVRSRL